ncbi:MAG: 2-succinyl-5-enolpyruvyl-6-hydroxy-3-cyclohexene-1-carboxylic-acid synthase, partial [Microbacterium sp.]|uniref:2-succinyl-5-enolpyruvyl-6-hydroxy-3- cyclohexene-1-carboxylic-acid synthase n=1 Tax=Microbacterium sp. TaxID=51671 RepID=UPI003A855ACF
MDGPVRAAASAATDAAAALLDALVGHGVGDIVLSPGSRSQSLALVAAALERAGRVRLHVRIDERVAGFTAVGLARETGMPAAVVCTSGTAAANLFPAALEAHHAGVPLLLLTADRPPELRGVGANQTTRQPGMFAPQVRFEADLPVPDETDATGTRPQTAMLRRLAAEAVAAARGGGILPAGPVHLNLPYREPLAGELPGWFALGTPAVEPADPEPGEPSVLALGPRTVVVAGADAGDRAEQVAFEGGWPLIAEIVSGARFGRQSVRAYRTVLREPALGGRVERAVVFGHPTLSREVTALLSRVEVEIVAVSGPGEPLNLNGATRTVSAVAVGEGDPDRAWLQAWLRAGHEASIDLAPPAPDLHGLFSTERHDRLDAVAAELAAVRQPIDRAVLVDSVWRATWPHDRLMLGSSRLVRVADDVLAGMQVPVHANRGLAGIDGTIATAAGISLASQAEGRPGVTRVLLGDLT